MGASTHFHFLDKHLWSFYSEAGLGLLSPAKRYQGSQWRWQRNPPISPLAQDTPHSVSVQLPFLSPSHCGAQEHWQEDPGTRSSPDQDVSMTPGPKAPSPGDTQQPAWGSALSGTTIRNPGSNSSTRSTRQHNVTPRSP